MSTQDRQAEREVADWYDASVRPLPVDRGPVWPRAKRFAEGFATGYAVATVIRRALGR